MPDHDANAMRGINRRNEKAMQQIAALLEDVEIDRRLTPGQMHAAVCEAMGCEPIVFVANLLAMAIDARSKITIAPADAARIGLALVDRIYGPPDIKKGKVANASFQLEFAWAAPATSVDEGERVE
jgi:hypothetical protein